MEQVGWEIINGTKALQHLLNQIKIALQSFKQNKSILNVNIVKGSTSSYTGWEVILNKDVKDLGRVGDAVNVSNGYARNFLFPRKLAVEASEKRGRDPR